MTVLGPGGPVRDSGVHPRPPGVLQWAALGYHPYGRAAGEARPRPGSRSPAGRPHRPPGAAGVVPMTVRLSTRGAAETLGSRVGSLIPLGRRRTQATIP